MIIIARGRVKDAATIFYVESMTFDQYCRCLFSDKQNLVQYLEKTLWLGRIKKGYSKLIFFGILHDNHYYHEYKVKMV